MSYSYQVYVGNLPTSITTEQLKDLFSQVGQVLHVWINTSFEKITYGFVEFDNVISAEDACERFNNLKLDSEQIKVSKKQSKLKNDNNYNNDNVSKSDSILLELPKRTKPSDQFLLKKALLKDLRKNNEIVNDFIKALFEMEQIKFDNQPETIITPPEITNNETLKKTIKRYFKPPCKKDTESDIDLSKGKHLTAEEYNKFFNLKLTKPRPCANPKKENYFSLDYRSVNN